MPSIDKAGRAIAALVGGTPKASRVPALMAARRRIIDQPMVLSADAQKLVPDALITRADDLAPLVDGSGLAANAEGLRMAPLEYDWAEASRLSDAAELGANEVIAQRAFGTFVPARGAPYVGVASYPSGVPNAELARNVRRHEIMHGYNEAARQGFEGLPFASRLTASLPRPLSIPVDEMVAQGVGGTRALDVPWGVYAEKYAAGGELGAARVARALEAAQKARQLGGQAAQFTKDHPVLTGAGVGTMYLLQQALAAEEEE